MANKKKEIKRQNVISLFIGIAFIILFNIISSYVFTRFDLTSEKRYTLSEPTRAMLKKLDDHVYFKVYLDGEMPAGFKKLSKATKELLDEFRAYNNLVEYTFIDPSLDEDKKDLYKILMQKGLKPTTVQTQKSGSSSQQVVFAGAIVTYKNRDIVVVLLNNQIGVASENVINNSIEALEYGFASSIKKLSVITKQRIAVINGIKGLRDLELQSAINDLSEFYAIGRISLDEQLRALENYDALIIAKPDSAFTEKDKFIIDQFVMRGGKVLWLLDGIKMEMDSLRFNNDAMALIQDNNVDDMLFKYGVKVNKNAVLDMNCLPIPFVTGQVGNQPQITNLPWFYFPLLSNANNHPIVNNLNLVKTEFASTIDTVSSSNVKKTILLRTSKYSKVINAPCRVSLELSKKQPPEGFFNKSSLPVAVLLEGEFTSNYVNRINQDIIESKDINFKEKSVPTKMIIVADGDVIKNQIFKKEDGSYYPLPLGFDKYIKQSFGNRDFILNAVNFLCDESGLLLSRSKNITLRMIDSNKTTKNKLAIQFANIILPITIILIFGFFVFMQKKRKFTLKK